MKILVTGAHFTPAQAVIEKLLEIPDIKIVYLGRKYARNDDKVFSVESKVLPDLGVKFIPITAGKLNRFLSLQTIISLLLTPVGFIQAFYYLLKERPDLIVSFGGFTGLPVVASGWLLSIPSIIHEQSLRMGLANKLSSFFAEKIAISFSDFEMPAFINRDKIIVTGNPIRDEFLNKEKNPNDEVKNFVEKAKRKRKPMVLVTAGNQGSHKINLIVEDKINELTQMATVIHQTGESKFDDFSNLKKYALQEYMVKKWIDPADLSFILDNVDLVICRAGINTLAELALKSTPALIVPITVGKEQTENAYYFSKLGLGEVFKESKLTPEVFIEKIRELLERKSGLKQLAVNAKKAVILDAQKRLVLEILLLKNKQDNLVLSN